MGGNSGKRTGGRALKADSNRVAWCITGAGESLKESVGLAKKLAKRRKLTLFISSAGEEVLHVYRLAKELKGMNAVCERLSGASFAASSLMWSGEYALVIIAPASANTVAKIRFGIADSLISSIAAQAQKKRMTVALLPTDFAAKQKTTLPSGKPANVFPTEQDIGNVRALSKRKFLRVLKSPKELAELVDSL